MQSHNFQCRKALPTDSREAIAKYLHLTDPYIYPAICPDPMDEDWIRLVGHCMETEHNIFHLEHLSVLLCEGQVCGVMCVLPCGQKLDFVKDTEVIAISGEFRKRLKPVTDGYFQPLIAESCSYCGHNIANICVDTEYRSRGLGSLLMSNCVERYGTQPIHLDVIASNRHAIALYEKFGFRITNEYYGFSGNDEALLCYHMLRT